MRVTVNVLVAPTSIDRSDGSNETSVGVGGTTCTAASAVVPFRLACTLAVPRATVPTDMSAVVCPASTVTVAGTVMIPLGLADTAMTVSVGCAEEIATVTDVVAPKVTELVGGSNEITVGGAGVTVTVLAALVPLRLAVICALPGLLAVTEIGASKWPAGTVTLLGTNATPGSVLLNATDVSAV